MKFSSTYTQIDASKINEIAKERKEAGDRYVQILAINYDDYIDLVYTFMTERGELLDYNVNNVSKDATLKSITEQYFEAFVCENEIHDLFGLKFDGLALDFSGKFYSLAIEKPMTVISKEELARREKEAKIAAAKAAKANAAKTEEPKTEAEVKSADEARGEEQKDNG